MDFPFAIRAETWKPIDNVDNEFMQTMGKFAVVMNAYRMKRVGMKGEEIKFIRVLKGETLAGVPEGTKNYRLVLAAEERGAPHFPWYKRSYQATVQHNEQHYGELNPSWTLLLFKPLHIPFVAITGPPISDYPDIVAEEN